MLNMGHTVGHAVEKLKNFTMAHGQCVAVGCMASAYISRKRGLISQEEYQETARQLQSFGLPLYVSGLSTEGILEATKSDKKMEKGQIKFVLMEKPGWAVVDTSVTDQELCEAIESIRLENQEVQQKMNREKKRLTTFILFILSTAVWLPSISGPRVWLWNI